MVKEKKFDPKFIFDYIVDCVTYDQGKPHFLTKLFGEPLPPNQFILTCADQDENDLLPSYKITDVPDEIMQILKEYPKDHEREWVAVFRAVKNMLKSNK